MSSKVAGDRLAEVMIPSTSSCGAGESETSSRPQAVDSVDFVGFAVTDWSSLQDFAFAFVAIPRLREIVAACERAARLDVIRKDCIVGMDES